ncbi:MAG: serpin family protein, partial [Calditrichaceae bacterium]
PLSVSYAFGMALNGANGSTYDAIRNVLELQGLTEDQINQSFKSLMLLLMQLDDKVIFEIANSIWYDDTFPVLKSFIDINKEYFDAEVTALDFADPAAVDIINGWVSDKTHEKIKEVLDKIPADAVMYLINAIYFKATWLYEFDKAYTTQENFYTEDQGTKKCQMMRTTADLNYYFDENFSAVTLPYGNEFYNMTIILPNTQTSIKDFITTFDLSSWQTLLNNMAVGKGTVELPKFISEYKLIMNDALIKMGMGIAFSGDADFSRIVEAFSIFISRVIHQTFVQVDEEGTEAAAVTIIEFKIISAPGGTPELDFVIRLDRPFYFIIHEKNSSTILFMGKIGLPEWKE